MSLMQLDIYELTGTADSPGEYYDDFVGKEVSGSYYDRALDVF